ncbi:olfactory receptor 8H1-like [Tachyglossus aculeatus]|uniref:olfactory receptor 8H1-like n=1 Tax=Tachyglossus aculeatus TaxID=9261 RepID=UPI0018F48CEA|nr:olfactory receptor 8H1-like [Tachyglossus aculeatus]
MTVLIELHYRLHTPMYFFLSNLSFTDLSYSSVIMPRMRMNLLTAQNTISFVGCFASMYLFVALAGAECFLLAEMAYDHYVAICSPLLYMVVVSWRVCVWVLAGIYLVSTINSLATKSFHFYLTATKFPPQPRDQFNSVKRIKKASATSRFLKVVSKAELNVVYLSHCSQDVMQTFLEARTISLIECAIQMYLFVACVTTEGYFLTVKAYDCFMAICNPMLYMVVMSLRVVGLLYETTISIYVWPNSQYAPENDKVVSMFYTPVISVLNPLIYSLRKKDENDAL